MNIRHPSRPLSYPFMIPSAGLVGGMGNLSLTKYAPPWLLPPYQLPSLSLHLTLDKGLPLPVLHPPLLSAAMTPSSSPTPLPTPPTHSLFKGELSKWHKDWMDLYGPKKRGQCYRPSLPILRVKRESLSLFWKLEREIGLQEALECFQKVLDSGREELEHDVMGFQDPWVHGDIVCCPKSKYHPNHPHHCVRKLDLSHLCFSLNFYFLMFLRLFSSMFPLLTYSQSFIPLIC